ncbi:MAG: hypothetical protein A3F10_02565 [Coxiella sp. RIFCSPHIGHO2_12_FULL_42_15]|nr:MAG: hypothetical protein A3F10_02565 [Coxiella sp. RIFCSPHIGHO2_12_FULL_42_15]
MNKKLFSLSLLVACVLSGSVMGAGSPPRYYAFSGSFTADNISSAGVLFSGVAGSNVEGYQIKGGSSSSAAKHYQGWYSLTFMPVGSPATFSFVAWNEGYQCAYKASVVGNMLSIKVDESSSQGAQCSLDPTAPIDINNATSQLPTLQIVEK